MSAAIEISISELHEHTDRYVREAAAKRILITDHGKPVAELQPATPSPSSEVPYFASSLSALTIAERREDEARGENRARFAVDANISRSPSAESDIPSG